MTLDDNPQLLDDAIPSEDEIAQSIMELVSYIPIKWWKWMSEPIIVNSTLQRTKYFVKTLKKKVFRMWFQVVSTF